MSLRLEGQDTLATITRDGELLADFKVAEFSVDMNISVEATQYVGEPDPTFREVHDGATFRARGHANGSAAKGVIAFLSAVQDRARRQSVGMKINFASTMIWPNGDKRSAQLPDCYIESPSWTSRGKDLIEFSFSGRAPRTIFK